MVKCVCVCVWNKRTPILPPIFGSQWIHSNTEIQGKEKVTHKACYLEIPEVARRVKGLLPRGRNGVVATIFHHCFSSTASLF